MVRFFEIVSARVWVLFARRSAYLARSGWGGTDGMGRWS